MLPNVEHVSDEELTQFIRAVKPWGARIVRGVCYGIVALMLIRANAYGVADAATLAPAIGILGSGTSSARLGQLAIAVLLIMAVLPPSIFATLLSAFA